MTAVPLRAATLVAALCIAASASAQPVAASVENTYARPGYPTIAVYVIGDVVGPGKWRVEEGAPLLDLLTVTRPLSPPPSSGGVVQSVHVRLYRQSDSGSRQLAVDSELEPLLVGSLAATPLRDGDLLRVVTEVTEPRSRMSFSEILSIVGTLASLAVLAVSVAQ
jgi:protein involved in polysaccharide export with SLBB domain